MIKAALVAGAILVAVVLIVAAIGWVLPVAHVASRSATFRRPPAEIYAAIADVAAYPQWRSDVTRVEMLPPNNGRVRFREHAGSDAVVMEVVEASAPSRFVTRIDDPSQPFGGTWTFEITPAGEGSRVTITENGEVYNPVFRFMSKFVFGHTATMDRFLDALAR